MDLSNKVMKKKIHSVKTWLDKAEASYDESANTKGELHLLLAKAEMQHLEETNKPFTKGFTLLGLPFVFLSLIMIGITLWSRTTVEPVVPYVHESTATVLTSSESTSLVPEWIKSKPLVYQKTDTVVRTEAPVAVTEPYERKEVSSKPSTITHESFSNEVMDARQIKQAVYEAGRSLRGN